MSAPIICGGGRETLSGCGDEIPETWMVYRCVDCDVPFHRHCAKKHFERDSGPTKEQQIAQLRDRCALIERACQAYQEEVAGLHAQIAATQRAAESSARSVDDTSAGAASAAAGDSTEAA